MGLPATHVVIITHFTLTAFELRLLLEKVQNTLDSVELEHRSDTTSCNKINVDGASALVSDWTYEL
jgi:hypothetical protein